MRYRFDLFSQAICSLSFLFFFVFSLSLSGMYDSFDSCLACFLLCFFFFFPYAGYGSISSSDTRPGWKKTREDCGHFCRARFVTAVTTPCLACYSFFFPPEVSMMAMVDLPHEAELYQCRKCYPSLDIVARCTEM